MSTQADFEIAIENLDKPLNEPDMEVGVYLLHRLEELGVKSLFGVPGDFNLGFLDLVEDYPGIEWIGNCNELNAAYAADGYARIKPGSVGAVLTTYGVGELSAINAVAGCYAEIVPVVHIAGFPDLEMQKKKPIMHHTLGDGRYNIYTEAAALITYSQTTLNNPDTAAAEIDRVLSDCALQFRPVYIALPTDVAYLKIASDRLRIPLPRAAPPNSALAESVVIEEIVKLIEQAKGDVAVLVDVGAVRYNVVEEVKAFVEETGFPVYATSMGKSIINEAYERYGGLYIGRLTRPEIKGMIEDAKLILYIGALKSDLNTGNFTTKLDVARTVELHAATTKIKFSEYPGVGMKALLPKLTSALSPFDKSQTLSIHVPKWTYPLPQEADEVISQNWLWSRMGEFLKPKDVIVAETGTSAFGVQDIPFPKDAVFVSQILWGSIGWAVGSTLGAALAAREKGLGRTILFIGDGSIQLTVQELSTMLREGLTPIIFILNNTGYTIERAIRGENRKYNDVANWGWTSLMKALGDVDGTRSKSYTVKTKTELDSLLNDEAFANAGVMQLVEIGGMRKFDAPYVLKVSTGKGETW